MFSRSITSCDNLSVLILTKYEILEDILKNNHDSEDGKCENSFETSINFHRAKDALDVLRMFYQMRSNENLKIALSVLHRDITKLQNEYSDQAQSIKIY